MASASLRLYSIYFRTAQAPNPDSRVTLSKDRDTLGVPNVRLDWRVNQTDVDSITSWLKVLDQDFRARGLGQIIPPAEGWEAEII